jgi:hypothetical protein
MGSRNDEVRAWLSRVRQVAQELDPEEANILNLRLRFLPYDAAKYSADIVETLRHLDAE